MLLYNPKSCVLCSSKRVRYAFWSAPVLHLAFISLLKTPVPLKQQGMVRNRARAPLFFRAGRRLLLYRSWTVHQCCPPTSTIASYVSFLIFASVSGDCCIWAPFYLCFPPKHQGLIDFQVSFLGSAIRCCFPRLYGPRLWFLPVRTQIPGCCCSHINSHNQVRGHRTGSSHSGAEEYPREKTHTPGMSVWRLFVYGTIGWGAQPHGACPWDQAMIIKIIKIINIICGW